jgi:hypothetical protein
VNEHPAFASDADSPALQAQIAARAGSFYSAKFVKDLEPGVRGIEATTLDPFALDPRAPQALHFTKPLGAIEAANVGENLPGGWLRLRERPP